MRKLFTRHERYDHIININFGFQSDKRMHCQLMKTRSLWDSDSQRYANVGDN